MPMYIYTIWYIFVAAVGWASSLLLWLAKNQMFLIGLISFFRIVAE